jgi:hypothetical protein
MPPGFTDEGLRAALRFASNGSRSGCSYCRNTWRNGTRPSCWPVIPAGSGTCSRTRGADVDGFVATACRIANGGTALDPEVVSQRLVRRTDPLRRLTPREHDVLALIAEGRSNAGIAKPAMSISALYVQASTPSPTSPTRHCDRARGQARQHRRPVRQARLPDPLRQRLPGLGPRVPGPKLANTASRPHLLAIPLRATLTVQLDHVSGPPVDDGDHLRRWLTGDLILDAAEAHADGASNDIARLLDDFLTARPADRAPRLRTSP